jgi:riboflavin kinase/FMN adenylyltransferase
VHRGHRRVLDTARSAGPATTVVTFWPHPRLVLGNQVELLSTLERRLELLESAGVDEVLIVDFTPEVAAMPPSEFCERCCTDRDATSWSARTSASAARGAATRAARGARVRRPGGAAARGRLLDRIRASAGRRGRGRGAAARPAGGARGHVVLGDQRGGTLGYPTANLAIRRAARPAYGIYAGAALGHRAAISIGVNPHYGGGERRIEPYLLDFEGDLYGTRLVVELWRRLRDEQAFAVGGRPGRPDRADVEATQAAERPSEIRSGARFIILATSGSQVSAKSGVF